MEIYWDLAGIFGLLGVVVSISRHQVKSKKAFLISEYPNAILWAVHFALIGAYAGMICSIFSILRSYVSLKFQDILLFSALIFITLAIWVVGIYNYQDWYSLLPLIGTTLASVAFAQKTRKSLSNLIAVHYVFWIMYALQIQSNYLLVTMVFGFISCIIGKIRHEQFLSKYLSFYKTKPIYAANNSE